MLTRMGPGEADSATRIQRAAGYTVGREAELSNLASLAQRARVIAVWGPPGVGKSRLAAAFGRESGRYTVCDLGPASTVPDVERTILEVLALPPAPHESPSAVSAHFDRTMLASDPFVLVLDDADGVEDLDRFAARLSALTTAVTFVITTRRRLRAPNVEDFEVPALTRDAALQLFTERAMQARADFRPDEVETLGRLVELLDRLPLPIELAASRVRLMSVGEMLRRLESGSQGLHRGLSAALNDSWSQLDPNLQEVLATLSLFSGSFALSDVEEVLGRHARIDVLEAVDALLERAWLGTTFDRDEVRFELLRTIRSFLIERFAELPTSTAIASSYDEYLVQRAQWACDRLHGPLSAEAFATLSRHRNALLTLLDRCVARNATDLMVRILVAMRWHMLLCGPLDRYEPALSLVLRQPDIATPQQRAELVSAYAEVLVMQGEQLRASDMVASAMVQVSRGETGWLALRRLQLILDPPPAEVLRAALAEDIAHARQTRDRFMEARLLERLGFAHTQLNELEPAWIALAEARDLFASIGANLFATGCSSALGYLELRLGRLDDAIERFAGAVALHGDAQSHFYVASARFNLGVALHAAGRTDGAQRELEAALRWWSAAGFVRYTVVARIRLGLVQAENGDLDNARATLAEAARVGRECRDHHNTAVAYTERAAIDFERRLPVDAEEVERMLAGIVPGLDPDAFASALVLLTAIAAETGRGALVYVNRIEELSAMFADADPYLGAVVGALRDIARAWQNLAIARQTPDDDSRRHHVARAWEWASRMLQPTPSIPDIPSSYVRLWANRLRTRGAELGEFANVREAFRGVLEVHRDGEWYRFDGRAPIDLSSRRPLRLLVRRLVVLSEDDPEGGLSVDELAEAGWPGEVLNLSTRRNRVYTAVRFLREMDLEEILVRDDTGYRFASDVALQVTTDSLG